jgi:hypothetical protein
MGEQSVKSIARPIRVYALRPERSRGADGKRVVHRFKFSARRCATPVDCRVAPLQTSATTGSSNTSRTGSLKI